jgi:hypothetical protein
MKQISVSLLSAGRIWGAIFLTPALILGRHHDLLPVLLLLGSGGVWSVMNFLTAGSPTRPPRQPLHPEQPTNQWNQPRVPVHH